MKNFIVKIFMFICGMIFLLEGAVLFMVYFGRFSSDEATAIYGSLLAAPGRLGIVAGMGAAFLCIGFIFLSRASRSAKKKQTLLIKDKGEIVRIPVSTVDDFINQIIEKNPHMNNVDIDIHTKGKWIMINIMCAYTGYAPLREAVKEMKEILRGEIKRVFEFPYLKIDFQLEGIRVDYEKYRAETAPGDEDHAEDVEAKRPSPPRGILGSIKDYLRPPAQREKNDKADPSFKDPAEPGSMDISEDTGQEQESSKPMPWEN